MTFPFFWNQPWKTIVALVFACIGLVLLSYYVGRARSLRLSPFYPKQRIDEYGEKTLGNRTIGTMMGALTCVSLLALLPANIGVDDGGKSREAPPAKNLTNEVKRVQMYLGWDDLHEGVRYFSFEVRTPSKLAVLNNNVRKPPKGYRWVLYNVNLQVLDPESEFYTSNMSLRLIDDKNQVYLPDYGSGANNAPEGYARIGAKPFWTPAYLLPNNVKPKRLEMIPFAGSDTVIFWTYPTPADLKKFKANGWVTNIPLSVQRERTEKRQAAQEKANEPKAEQKATVAGKPSRRRTE
jgi:hypothetical protein